MFEAWGRGLYRARRLTLVIGLLFAVGAAVWGTGVFGKLNSGNTFSPPGNGITVRVGGATATEVAINSEVSANIARAESISFPVLLILLVIIFGSVVAAIAPLLLGGLAILGSLTVLRLLTLATTVSVYSVNITTIMGLGLGIDYGL